MEITLNKLDAVNGRLLLKVEPADYAEEFAKTVKEYRKRASIPGFRPGMAPVGMVKNKYGKLLLADALDELVAKNIFDYINNNHIEAFGQPMPTEGFPENDFADGNSFEFSFDLALSPELTFRPSKSDKLTLYKIVPSDSEIENEIESLRTRFGEYEKDPAVSQADDVLRGEIVELDEKGEVKEGGIKNEYAMLGDYGIKDEAEKAKLYGVALEGSFVINPRKAFDNDAAIGSLLGKPADEVKDFNADCKFTVKSISRYKKAELNQDFYDKAFGKGKVSTKEEAAEELRHSADAQNDTLTMRRFMDEYKKYVLDKLKDVEMPEATLRRWVEFRNRDREEALKQIDELFPRMIEDLKWDTLTNKIAEEEGLKVEESDVLEFAKQVASQQFARYGIHNADSETLTSYAKEMLEDKDQRESIENQLLESKIFEHLKKTIKLETKKVSFAEFAEGLK